MPKGPMISKNVRFRAALVLICLWVLSWALLAVSGRCPQPLGVPLITWAHIVLGLLGILVSLGSVFLPSKEDDTP